MNIVQGTIKILKKLDSSSGSTTCFPIIGGGAGLSPTLGLSLVNMGNGAEFYKTNISKKGRR